MLSGSDLTWKERWPGHLARIGPNDLVTDSPEILRKMGAVRSPYTRSDWYNSLAFDHKVNHVLCERDEKRHVEKRNKLIPGVCLHRTFLWFRII